MAEIARRIGICLYLTCDEEANWRGWQTIALSGGLGRGYRDPRFDLAKPDRTTTDDGRRPPMPAGELPA